MKHTGPILSLILGFYLGSYSIGYGQTGRSPKSILSIEHQYLMAKVDNPIRIVAQQDQPVSIHQLQATLQVYNGEKESLEIRRGSGYFIIRPDTIGMVEINIVIGDTLETKTLRVRPMVAVGRLGRFGANTDEKIKVGAFKAQTGLIANVECCGFDARCQVSGFQLIRISKQNQAKRAVNQGGRFEDHSRAIIRQAESGDIYVFRQIRYRCPGSEKPQRLDDMVFEVE